MTRAPRRRVPPLPWVRTRYRILVTLTVLTFAVLGGRLVDLQLVHGAEYLAQAEGNAIKARPVLPPRGRMFDRTGRLLVANEPSFTVMVTPALFDARQSPDLARYLGLPDTLLAARLSAARAHNPNTPVAVAQGLSLRRVAQVFEEGYHLQGVAIVDGQRRIYPSTAAAPFAVGSVGEVGPEAFARWQAAGRDYRLGDVVGLSGMERAYEEALRGRPGKAFVVVDAHGRVRGRWYDGFRDVPPGQAYDLTLTLDAHLQAFAESLLVGKRGAVVALDPQTGEILTYASAPAYHPADLVPPIDAELWARLTADPGRPLFDRAALSTQPLGSTIKPLMALMALEEGVIDSTTVVWCNGAYVWGGHVFRDHGAHGRVTVHDAIRRSCNVFFFTTMMRTPFDTWTRWGHDVGFGVPFPTDLPVTGRGLWPDSSYFDEAFGAWTRGYLVSLGIGQGDLGVTPLQLARYTALLANGGTPVTPHLASSLRNPVTGEFVRPGLPRPEPLPFTPAHMRTVREAMLAVVENGTGHRSRIEGIAMAGKTGTAENPHGEDHALFIGFAPFDEPRIAIAVLVENAGFGSQSAAPIASLLVERYLTGRTPPERRALLDGVLAIRSRDRE